MVNEMIITSKAFGIVFSIKAEAGKEKNHVLVIIPKHARIPHSGTYQISTKQSDQRSVKIELMEQADGTVEPSEKMEDYNALGSGIIDGLPPNLPAGTPVHIRFNLYEDGILSVVIICSGKECHIKTHVSRERKGGIDKISGLTVR
jgi:molecular chaperone DnaK (HSP70)